MTTTTTRRADVTTPLPRMSTEELPADLGKPAAKKPLVTLSTTVQHRGRQITISATDITVDQFCDLLDRASYAAPAPAEWQKLPDGTPLCPKHGTPMRLRQRQGDEWWSHNVGTQDAPCWCKGYAGKDSPGFDH